MSIWLIIAIVLGTALVMEFVAWATHKYVMHGMLWMLHSDHHRKDHYGFLERNDSFFLIFAIPSMGLFIAGKPPRLAHPLVVDGLGHPDLRSAVFLRA